VNSWPPDEVKSRGVKAAAILADVTRLADCERMAAETVKALGSIDVLVNNAGIIAAGPVAEFSEEAWDRVMAVNAKGRFCARRPRSLICCGTRKAQS